MSSLKHRFSGLWYPELRSFSEDERHLALARAKEARFDSIELVGMAIGLVIVTTFTSYAAEGLSVAARIAKGLANFVIAIPLLGLTLGPFLWRRTRRGLRIELEGRRNTQPHR